MKRRVPRLDSKAKSLAQGEIVGLQVTVSDSSDAGLVGLSGQLVDETLNTFTIRVGGPGGRRVQVSKAGNVFAFVDPKSGEVVAIDGRAVQFRSQDRTKKVK